MYNTLHNYLLINRLLPIPSVGTFHIDTEPAQLFFSNQEMMLPPPKISFTPSNADINPELAAFLSAEEEIPVAIATQLIEQFGIKIKRQITRNDSIDLPGIGQLYQNETGKLLFREQVTDLHLFPAVAAERVVRPNAEHDILVGEVSRTNTEMKVMLSENRRKRTAADYWWVYALVLAILSVAAIYYYYTTYNVRQ